MRMVPLSPMIRSAQAAAWGFSWTWTDSASSRGFRLFGRFVARFADDQQRPRLGHQLVQVDADAVAAELGKILQIGRRHHQQVGIHGSGQLGDLGVWRIVGPPARCRHGVRASAGQPGDVPVERSVPVSVGRPPIDAGDVHGGRHAFGQLRRDADRHVALVRAVDRDEYHVQLRWCEIVVPCGQSGLEVVHRGIQVAIVGAEAVGHRGVLRAQAGFGKVGNRSKARYAYM